MNLSKWSGDGELSVRGFIRQLRWVAPLFLAVFLVLWVAGWPRGASLVDVVLLWAVFTVGLGPLVWVRGVPAATPGWWKALGLAALWSVGVIVLFGAGLALVAVWLEG